MARKKWTIELSRSNETRWFKAPSENKAYEIVRTLLAERKAGEDVIRISVFVDEGLGSGPELFDTYSDKQGWYGPWTTSGDYNGTVVEHARNVHTHTQQDWRQMLDSTPSPRKRKD